MKNSETSGQARSPLRVPFFYGWVVVALTFLTSLNGAGVRSALVVMIYPLEQEFGWSRSAIAGAAAITLFLYGATAPVNGWLLDRFGPRRVMVGALTLLLVGTAGTIYVQELWQFFLFWGIAIGLGAGGTASVLGAAVAHRWFAAQRGLALGILNSAGSTGQLIFLPLLMWLVVAAGWRSSLVLAIAVAAVNLLLVQLWMRDDPSEIGLDLYGAKKQAQPSDLRGLKPAASRVSVFHAARNADFWMLCGAYFICGGTANGLIGTHLVPHALDLGIPEMTAATAVGIMGAMNFVGTLLSGYLTDRVDPRKVLSLVFALRGVSLFILPYVTDYRGLFIFSVIYGLDWFATVPPIVTLTGDIFGKQSIGRIYGWIFLSHQMGGALAAVGAGEVVMRFGDYHLAFFIGGAMTLVAATMSLMVRRQQHPLSPLPGTEQTAMRAG